MKCLTINWLGFWFDMIVCLVGLVACLFDLRLVIKWCLVVWFGLVI